MTARPQPVLDFRRRCRTDGTTYLIAVADEDLTIPAGAELHLRRLHSGNLPTPEFALAVIPPRAALSQRERRQAAVDRLDGSAIRVPRDEFAAHPPQKGVIRD